MTHNHPPRSTQPYLEVNEDVLWGGVPKPAVQPQAEIVPTLSTAEAVPVIAAEAIPLPASLDAKQHETPTMSVEEIINANVTDLPDLRRKGSEKRDEFLQKREEVKAAFKSLPPEQQARVTAKIAEAKQAEKDVATARAAINEATALTPTPKAEKPTDPIFAATPRKAQHPAKVTVPSSGTPKANTSTSKSAAQLDKEIAAATAEQANASAAEQAAANRKVNSLRAEKAKTPEGAAEIADVLAALGAANKSGIAPDLAGATKKFFGEQHADQIITADSMVVRTEPDGKVTTVATTNGESTTYVTEGRGHGSSRQEVPVSAPPFRGGEGVIQNADVIINSAGGTRTTTSAGGKGGVSPNSEGAETPASEAPQASAEPAAQPKEAALSPANPETSVENDDHIQRLAAAVLEMRQGKPEAYDAVEDEIANLTQPDKIAMDALVKEQERKVAHDEAQVAETVERILATHVARAMGGDSTQEFKAAERAVNNLTEDQRIRLDQEMRRVDRIVKAADTQSEVAREYQVNGATKLLAELEDRASAELATLSPEDQRHVRRISNELMHTNAARRREFDNDYQALLKLQATPHEKRDDTFEQRETALISRIESYENSIPVNVRAAHDHQKEKIRDAVQSAPEAVPATTMHNLKGQLIEFAKLKDSKDPKDIARRNELDKNIGVLYGTVRTRPTRHDLAQFEAIQREANFDLALSKVAATPPGHLTRLNLSKLPVDEVALLKQIIEDGNTNGALHPAQFDALRKREADIDAFLAPPPQPQPQPSVRTAPPTPTGAPLPPPRVRSTPNPNSAPTFTDFLKNMSAAEINQMDVSQMTDAQLLDVANLLISANREENRVDLEDEQHDALKRIAIDSENQHELETNNIENTVENAIMIRNIQDILAGGPDGRLGKRLTKRNRKQYEDLLKEAEEIRDRLLGTDLRPEAEALRGARLLDIDTPLENTAYTWEQAAKLKNITVKDVAMASPLRQVVSKLPLIGQFVKPKVRDEHTMSTRDALLDGTVGRDQIPKGTLIYDANGKPLGRPQSAKKVAKYKKDFNEIDDLDDMSPTMSPTRVKSPGRLEKRRQKKLEERTEATIERLVNKLQNPLSSETRSTLDDFRDILNNRKALGATEEDIKVILKNADNFAKAASDEIELNSWVSLGMTNSQLSDDKKDQLRRLQLNEDGTPLDVATQWPLIRANIKKAQKLAVVKRR